MAPRPSTTTPKPTPNRPEPRTDPWAVAPRRSLGGRARVLNVEADPFDRRDLVYTPRPCVLVPIVPEEAPAPVRNQGDEGGCTGFALAAVIDAQLRRRGDDGRVSPRYLYEHAKRYDEWRGEGYEGSSIRGAMKGFWHHGACSEAVLPWKEGQRLARVPEEAYAQAAVRPLGAYFRVPTSEIATLQAAITEAGAVLVSADVHDGWDRPRRRKGEALAEIAWEADGAVAGGHAFALVGFDERGFVIQNSWGKGWGTGGLARLRYEDWLEHRVDAWVAQVGVGRTEHLRRSARATAGAEPAALVRERDIHGHYLAIRDGVFDERGRFHSARGDLAELVRRVEDFAAARRRTRAQVVLYAHGGLVPERAAAAKAADFREPLLANGLYPIHLLWHTGFFEALGDALRGRAEAEGLVGGRLSEAIDARIEARTRPLGRLVWGEMKADAARAVHGPRGAGGAGPVMELLKALAGARIPVDIHLLGHSAGTILLGHTIDAAARAGLKPASLAYFAPAITTADFGRLVPTALGTAPFHVWTMKDADERDDQCALVYRKSLLYLVSEAFEQELGQPLLGLARNIDRDHEGGVSRQDRSVARWLTQRRAVTFQRPAVRSGSLHGAFDDDPGIVNAWMTWLLGRPPSRAYGS